MSKKVVLSGYYGYENFGDEAILSVIIDHLTKKGSDITVLSHNPDMTTSSYNVSAVKNFNLFKVICAIKNCDVLISGGGSLLQDVTSLKSLLYYSFVIYLALIFKKEIIIFAQGLGPLQKKISQDIVRFLMSRANLVTVRDSKSLELLENWGIGAKLVSDPVFSIDLAPCEQENVVGVQLRAFKTMNDDFLQQLAKVVVRDFSDKKIEMYVFQNALDMEICNKFNTMLKKPNPDIQTEVVHSISKNDFIVKISRLKYLIAMRFHAVLVAVKMGVPTVAINYDAKVAKIAYEAQLPLLTISSDENFEPAFAKLKELNRKDLITYAKTKTFDWTIFDEILDF